MWQKSPVLLTVFHIFQFFNFFFFKKSAFLVCFQKKSGIFQQSDPLPHPQTRKSSGPCGFRGREGSPTPPPPPCREGGPPPLLQASHPSLLPAELLSAAIVSNGVAVAPSLATAKGCASTWPPPQPPVPSVWQRHPPSTWNPNVVSPGEGKILNGEKTVEKLWTKFLLGSSMPWKQANSNTQNRQMK